MTNVVRFVDKTSNFRDRDGNVLAGGFIYTYVNKSDTPIASYTDGSGSTTNANPVILDSVGRANIWLPAYTPCRVKVTDQYNNPICVVDDVFGYVTGLTEPLPSSGVPISIIQNGSPDTVLGTDGSGNIIAYNLGTNLSSVSGGLDYTGTVSTPVKVTTLQTTVSNVSSLILPETAFTGGYPSYEIEIFNLSFSGSSGTQQLWLNLSNNDGASPSLTTYTTAARAIKGVVNPTSTDAATVLGLASSVAPNYYLNYDMASNSGSTIGISTSYLNPMNYIKINAFNMLNPVSPVSLEHVMYHGEQSTNKPVFIQQSSTANTIDYYNSIVLSSNISFSATIYVSGVY